MHSTRRDFFRVATAGSTLLGFDIEPIFPIGAVKDYGVYGKYPLN